MKKLTARRLASGHYEVPTPHGTYRIEYVGALKGWGAESGWFVFRPTETIAHDCFPTKREAMAYLDRVCTPDREQARRETN